MTPVDRESRLSSGGPRVLLVHGFFSCAAAWDPLRRELAALGIDSLAPDLLGYGAARHHTLDYTLENVVHHLERTVARERPTHVFGHSMGGIVALALAKKVPGTFARIGLVGLPVYENRRQGLRYLHRRGWQYRAMLHSASLSHAGCFSLHRLRRIWSPFVGDFVPGQPKGVLLGAFDHDRAGHEGINTIVFAGHVPKLVSGVVDPVIALHGGRDRAAPAEVVRELAERQGWDFDFEPQHAHQAIVEHPRDLARWVQDRLLREASSRCDPATTPGEPVT